MTTARSQAPNEAATSRRKSPAAPSQRRGQASKPSSDQISTTPAESDVHYTVFVRLPFPRSDFQEPPQVQWDFSKDKQLWKLISKVPNSKQLNWKQVSERLEAPLDFVLQQAAWLYERHFEEMKAQMKMIGGRDESRIPSSPIIDPGATESARDGAVQDVDKQCTTFPALMSCRVPLTLSSKTRDLPQQYIRSRGRHRQSSLATNPIRQEHYARRCLEYPLQVQLDRVTSLYRADASLRKLHLGLATNTQRHFVFPTRLELMNSTIIAIRILKPSFLRPHAHRRPANSIRPRTSRRPTSLLPKTTMLATPPPKATCLLPQGRIAERTSDQRRKRDQQTSQSMLMILFAHARADSSR